MFKCLQIAFKLFCNRLIVCLALDFGYEPQRTSATVRLVKCSMSLYQQKSVKELRLAETTQITSLNTFSHMEEAVML